MNHSRKILKKVFANMAQFSSTHSCILGMLTQHGLTIAYWTFGQTLTMHFKHTIAYRHIFKVDKQSRERLFTTIERLKMLTFAGGRAEMRAVITRLLPPYQ